MKSKLLLLFLLIYLNISAIYSADFQLYSDEGAESKSGLLTSPGDSQDETGDASFDFNQGDGVLKAPPGGGEPIGGVPVEDAYLFLLPIIGVYICYRRLSLKRKCINN